MTDPATVETEKDSRTRILEAARRVLAQRGYDATTMRAISAEAGVAVGLANYYFHSRRELLAEVIATSREHFLGVLDARLPEGEGPEVLRRVHEMAAALVDLMPEWHALFADLDANGLRDEQLAQAAAANKRRGQEDMHERLAYLCQRLGVEPPADLDGISAVLLAAHDGIGVRALLDSAFEPIAAHLALERMFLAAVAPDVQPVNAEWDRDPYSELDLPGNTLRARGRK